MTAEPDDRAKRGDHSWARGWMSDSWRLLLTQALTVIATSVAAIMIARNLAPSDWAVFSALLGLSMALALVADFGVSTLVLRELSSLVADHAGQTPRSAGRLVSSGVIVNALIATPLLVGAIAWAVGTGIAPATAFALVSLLAYGALTSSANALEAELRSRRRVRLVLAASAIEKCILLACLATLLLLGAGLAGVGAAYLAAGLSRIAFDSAVVFREQVVFVIPSLRSVLEFARASVPFALNAGSLNLVPRLDIVLLISLSTASAAWFAIGDRVLGPALFIPSTLGSALYPFMATAEARRTAPWKVAGALALAGGAFAVVGALLAPVLVPLVFGDAYQDAVPVVQVMLFSLPLVYATSPLLVLAYSYGREHALLFPALGASLAGTIAIALGQALGGTVLAAAGLVVRAALVLGVVALVAIPAWRRLGTELRGVATPREISPHSP